MQTTWSQLQLSLPQGYKCAGWQWGWQSSGIVRGVCLVCPNQSDCHRAPAIHYVGLATCFCDGHTQTVGVWRGIRRRHYRRSQPFGSDGSRFWANREHGKDTDGSSAGLYSITTNHHKLHPSLANFHRWQSGPWTIKWAYRYWVRDHDLSRFSKHYLLLYTKDTFFYQFSPNLVKALLPVTSWTSSLAKRITNLLNPVLERFAPIILDSVLQWMLLGKSIYIYLNTVLYWIFLLEKCVLVGYSMLPYEDFAFSF